VSPDKLTQPFSEELFAEITEQLIGHDFTKDNRNISITGKNLKFVKVVKNLGHYPDLNLHVFIVKNSSENDARIGLSKELFGIMKEYSFSNALIATYNDSGNWRYSLLTSNLSIAKDGHVVRSFSNPKRYSYLLGMGAKVVTPYKYLIKNGKISDFSDLQKRFSVEVVNNDFYKEIAKLYDDLVGTSNIKGVIKYPQDGDMRHQFAVRLIGRIVFCWFLREKNSDNNKSLISTEILSGSAANKESNYYHKILAPLFFEVLNKPNQKRPKPYKDGAFGDIPYLNGGLFSPQYDDHYKFDSAIEQSVPGLVNIPDQWIRRFFDLLETYHFTVDENTSVDIDLSIDPEMLGRIFENLLARINPVTGETVRKTTGSFYTPRAIVEYMVDETITQYIINKTGIEEQKIKSLVSYDLDDDTLSPINETEKAKVIKALGKVKILDPACGSGAFPIGVLQKIVFILQQIDPEAKLWFENQINAIPPESRRLIEEEFKNKNFDYIRKLGVIRESIFGVDIQPIATEIARLRCFLTLIVDERVIDNEPNRGIYPLPNLDFKFVTANTLIQLNPANNQKVLLFEDTEGLDELANIMTEYFSSPSNERDGIKYCFSQTQKKIFERLLNGFKDVSSSTNTYKLSSWDPFELKPSEWFDPEWMFGIKTGFDIVIGNPPYVGEKGHKEIFQPIAKSPLGQRFYAGKMDLFYFFFHLGLDVLADGGVLAYITTNYYVTATGAKKLREDIRARSTVLDLINFGELKIFESALGQHNMISILKKSKYNLMAQTSVTHQKGYLGSEIIQSIINKDDKNTEYYLLSQNDIYSGENIKLTSGSLDQILNRVAKNPTLNDVAKINQGLQAGADTLTRKHIEKFGDLGNIDDGIFVIDLKNARDKAFFDSIPDSERSLLKPFYKNSNIYKYISDNNPTKYIIYITKDTNMINYPAILNHLKQFEPILKERLITYNEKYNWYKLHRERDATIFETEKICVPYRSKFNTFGYTDSPWYFRSDSYSIISRDNKYPTKFLLGILNSELIYKWLSNRGKRKGEMLELFSEPLSRIPIPKITDKNIKLAGELESIVNKILEAKKADKNENIEKFEKEIDKIVFKLYDLSPDEISIIEESYND